MTVGEPVHIREERKVFLSHCYSPDYTVYPAQNEPRPVNVSNFSREKRYPDIIMEANC